MVKANYLPFSTKENARLLGLMEKAGLNCRQVACRFDPMVPRTTLYQKLQGEVRWKIGEPEQIERICREARAAKKSQPQQG
jgi:hypothetical protein